MLTEAEWIYWKKTLQVIKEAKEYRRQSFWLQAKKIDNKRHP
jgi:hypothetical protein